MSLDASCMHARDGREIAIRLAAMDYMEGWYEGDVKRMERCLHPNLAKRAVKRNGGTGKKYLTHVTKEDLLRYTRDGGGTDVPRDYIYYKIDILDVYDDVAMVRAESYTYIDYLQLVKVEKTWQIVNVLYAANHGQPGVPEARR